MSKELMKQCLAAFNEIKNTRIKSLDKTTYQLATELEKCIKEQENYFTIGGWSIVDVQHSALDDEERPVRLTAEEAREVLVDVENTFDASRGVNWDTINDAVDNWLKDRELEEDSDDEGKKIWRTKK